MSTSGRTVTPGWRMSITNIVRPACRCEPGSVRATIAPKSAHCATLVHTFWPVSSQPASSATARVDSPATSDPAPGSENSWHQISSPRSSGRR